jgi:hypothetical protein
MTRADAHQRGDASRARLQHAAAAECQRSCVRSKIATRSCCGESEELRPEQDRNTQLLRSVREVASGARSQHAAAAECRHADGGACGLLRHYCPALNIHIIQPLSHASCFFCTIDERSQDYKVTAGGATFYILAQTRSNRISPCSSFDLP